MDSAFRSLRRVREQRRWSDTLGKQQSNRFSSWDSTVILIAYRLGIFHWEHGVEHLFVWTWLGLISYGGIIHRLSLIFISLFVAWTRLLFFFFFLSLV